MLNRFFSSSKTKISYRGCMNKFHQIRCHQISYFKEIKMKTIVKNKLHLYTADIITDQNILNFKSVLALDC